MRGPTALTLRVRRRGNLYVAYDVYSESEYLGGSPDEAIGAAVRHCWLQEALTPLPIYLHLDIQSDKPEDET